MKEYAYREMLQASESSRYNNKHTNNEEPPVLQQRTLEKLSEITVTSPVSNTVIKKVYTFIS